MNRLDLIIDALELEWKQNNNEKFYDKYIYALAAARELKELKPVAWGAKSIYGGFEGLSFDKQPRFDSPLYALDKALAQLEQDPVAVKVISQHTNIQSTS
jgi:hypothetical protein